MWRHRCLAAAMAMAAAGAAMGAERAATKPARPAAPQIAVFPLCDEVFERQAGLGLGLSLEPAQTLYDLVHRLSLARRDDRVKAVVLTFEEPVLGWAQMQELRSALRAVRRANKDVYCYLEEVDTGIYQLASACSRVVLAPAGQIELTGLHAEAPYFKGLLDKIKLEADIEQIGAYKSAGEPFTRTGPSDEARAMLDWLARDLFEQMVEAIAEGRQMPPQRVRELIDEGPFNAPQALKAQLVDEVLDAEAFLDTLADRYGEEVKLVRDYGVETEPMPDLSNPFALLKMLTESTGKKKGKAKPVIAVVYADGILVTGQSEPGLLDAGGEVGSTTLRRVLSRVRDDDEVKGVVIRVDSPGGSALASDILWGAVKDLAEGKPAAVSMGNVAASGGYYLSVGAQTVFADPGTITGSIGVIGGKLVTKGLWDWLGVAFHEVALGQNADLYNTNRRFDDRQREIIRGQLRHVYGLFTDRVGRGRQGKLSKSLEEVAGGRVFTGRQAKSLGLVDELGGLEDAIAFVADRAKLADYDVRLLPEPRSLLDLLIESLTGQTEEDGEGIRLKGGGAPGAARRLPARWLLAQPLVQEFVSALRQTDPARARAVVRGLLRLELLRQGEVLAVLPDEFLVR